MWSRLLSLVEEQAQTLIRTAFSNTVREARDLSAGIFDLSGRMLAQAVTGTPSHVNATAGRSRCSHAPATWWTSADSASVRTRACEAIRQASAADETTELNLKHAKFPMGATYRLGEAFVRMLQGHYAPPCDWDIEGGPEGGSSATLAAS